jgi:hypothetical protein
MAAVEKRPKETTEVRRNFIGGWNADLAVFYLRTGLGASGKRRGRMARA